MSQANKPTHSVTRDRRPKQFGFSLLEVLISVAAGSILVVGVVKLQDLKQTAAMAAKKVGKEADLRSYVRQTISCKETIEQGNCGTTTERDVQPKLCTGENLIASESASKFEVNVKDTALVKLRCGGTALRPNQLKVLYKKRIPAPSGQTSSQPAWEENWSDLMQGIPYLCDMTPTVGQLNTFQIVQDPVEKPVTDLHLIIDNSYSMAAIQTKTSASVRSLMDQLATNKLKVDIYLYTTTLYLANWSFPEMSATLNGSSIYPFTAFFYYFEDGVSKHSSWDYGTKNGSLGLKQLTAKNITTGANLPGPTYSIGSGETIEFTANFTPKSILGAPISIRQSDTAASISAAKSKLSNAVSSLGVDGSDKEQPLAVLQKIAKSYATSGGKRFASWIVTNEDDQTRSELLTLKNSYQNVPGGVQLQFNYYESVARFAYEYRVPDYFRDGVLVTPAYWVEATGAVGLPPCGASCSKTPGFFTCSAEELAFTEAYTADMIPKWGASYRPAPSLKCVRQTYLTTGNSANLPSGTTCNTVLPALGNQTGIAWGTSRWAIGINRAAASPFCVEKAIPDQVVKVDPRIAATAPVGDLSTSINAQLSTIFGPRGYGIALIANDGTNCGQGGETKTPPILSRLLASSPSPDQGLGLCAPDYNSLATKLAEYALENPETTYAHGMNKNDIESLTVRYQGETVDRTIPTDQYVVTNKNIIFSTGAVKVGDQVTIVRKATAGNGGPQNRIKCSN